MEGGGKKKNMASRHSIPQRTCVRRGEREKADEESVMDKVKVQKKGGIGREGRGIKQKKMTRPKRDGEPSTNK